MNDGELAAIRMRVVALETVLSIQQIDNFNVGRRKLNARKKYLQTQWIGYAEKEKLEEYEEYLKNKFPVS
jgi:hypothetical protein